MAATNGASTRQQEWAARGRQGVSFDIPAELHSATREVAEELDRPMAWVFRRALAEFVEKHRKARRR